MENLEYRGYTIHVRFVKRDWSEGAVEYSVPSLGIEDECEDHEVLYYASQDIDKELKN